MAKSKYLTKLGGEEKFVKLFSIICVLVYTSLRPWNAGIFLSFLSAGFFFFPFPVLEFHPFFDIELKFHYFIENFTDNLVSPYSALF